MIAYTSVNHMGYIVLAVGAAGVVSDSSAQAQQLAVTGAVVQMVSHGLITSALFLLAGVLYERRQSYDLNAFGRHPGTRRSSPSPHSRPSDCPASAGSSPNSRFSPAALEPYR
jgi:formate hydrogenlyase subunit 3/multisubunit Na+/H+ antiporter MnhD subunit